MKYMLLIYDDEAKMMNMSPEEMESDMQTWFAFDAETQAATTVLGGEPLNPTSTATTVRMSGGVPVITDGPFAETKEQLGGFYLIEADDLDEAIAIASKMPNLPSGGCVEVRATIEMPQP